MSDQPISIHDAQTRRVILEMVGHDADHAPYIRTLASDLDMSVEPLRRILRALEAQGLVTYAPIINRDTGWACGSTYWLTDAGLQLQARLAERAAA